MSLGIRPPRQALSSLYQALDFTDHLRLTQPALGYSTEQSTAAHNIDANRYRDILAYDHALLPGPYLNAAYIPALYPTSLSFIVSQAPLPDTYTAFYTHLVAQRVRVLVNLTALVEKGRIKAHQYWADAPSVTSATVENSDIRLQNGWTVSTQSENRIVLDSAAKSTLLKRVIHVETGENESGGWALTQFHVTSWPDHGVFPTETLLGLMRETQMVPMPKMFPPLPTWIHCSAGVGRSGTLAAAYIAQAVLNSAKTATQPQQTDASLIERNHNAQVWDLPVRIVEHLRRYRPRMVQTEQQFEAVYEITAELAADAGLLDKKPQIHS